MALGIVWDKPAGSIALPLGRSLDDQGVDVAVSRSIVDWAIGGTPIRPESVVDRKDVHAVLRRFQWNYSVVMTIGWRRRGSQIGRIGRCGVRIRCRRM